MTENETHPDDYEAPMGNFAALPLLPDDVFLEGNISDVTYRTKVFNGAIQYVTDKNNQKVVDAMGNPIPQKEFAVTIELKNYSLSNGQPRRLWINAGKSRKDSSKLMTLLHSLQIPVNENTTPREIESALKSTGGVKFMLETVTKGGKQKQAILLTKIRRTNG